MSTNIDENINYDEGFDAEQEEPLTVRLKGLIRDYPEGIGIIKELIQNADDAEASLVRITQDLRTHHPRQLPDERMNKLMGPAILVYNNQVFTDKDFESILKLGVGGKRLSDQTTPEGQASETESLWKTGRFGLGFNSVYNVTDYPSFISRDRIIFFDPHCFDSRCAILNKRGHGWFYAKAGWWDKYPDFMRIYEAGGLPTGVKDFEGTIFRLPLRTVEQARRSHISEQPFEKKNIGELLDELQQSGEEMLLFLKCVEEIHVCEISEDGSRRELISITTQNSKEVRKNRQALLNTLKPGSQGLLQQCQSNRATLPSVSYRHEIRTLIQGHSTTSTWRVSSVIRVDEKRELLGVIEEMSKRKEKAVSWAGAAARISTSSPEANSKPFIGRAYCFLPLPLKTGLPIHINGFFDLNSSRDKLTSDNLTGKDRLRVTWNQLLVRHVVSHACANLIEGLVQDIGEDKPDDLYALWPVDGKIDEALTDLPHHVIQLLHHKEVIRATGDKRWLKPSQVYLLPANGQDLREPLCADGLAFPDPILPERIEKAFAAANVSLVTFTPSLLRQRLKGTPNLGVPLEQVGRLCLGARKWIVSLLRYCLSDGYRDLNGLPLAILANGTLQAFGHNPPGFIYTADEDARNIYADQPEWFLDPDLLKQVPQIKGKSGLLEMTPKEVAKRLGRVVGLAQAGGRQWQPDANTLPNANWLAQVYRYFTKVNELPSDELEQHPLVPGSDGKLHQGGKPQTPLLCRTEIDTKTREALGFFGILFVQAKEELHEAIAAFMRRHPDTLFRHLTAPDVVDALHSLYCQSNKSLPKFNELNKKYYTSLLNFLTERHWVRAYDQTKQSKLRQLPIYPTTAGQPVALSGDVYILGEYPPPEVAGSFNLLRLGTNQEWKSLFVLLKIPVLNCATLIRDFLLPGYEKLPDEQQKLVSLTWIRKHLDVAQTELSGTVGQTAALKALVSKAPLVRCKDGKFYAASSIYDPRKSKVVRDVLGEGAPFPDMKYYSDIPELWLEFFHSLGMQQTPSATDLLRHIDLLCNKAWPDKPDSVADDCLVVFRHVVQHWSQLKDERIGDANLRFSELLKIRRWLPVERSEQALQQYPGAMMPESRLYCPNEVALSQNAHLVASQRPLFKGPRLAEMERSLGFESQAKPEVVVKHFETLINLWQRDGKATIDVNNLETSLKRIYQYFYDNFVVGNADGTWIQSRFKGRECLWHDGKFWRPEHAFQVFVERFFGKRRIKIDKQPPIRDVYEFLGQKKGVPGIDDYLAFLHELGDEYNGEPLNDEDEGYAVQVLQRLDHALKQEGRSAKKLNVLLLTEDKQLLSTHQALILIPDADWRRPFLDSTKVKVLHEKVPQGLAADVGSYLLSKATEHPVGEVQEAKDAKASNFCQRWQITLRTPEFEAGLKRIIKDEHGERNRNFQWLKTVEVRPASRILTKLALNNILIASDVRGFYYFNPSSNTFYIRCDDKSTMLYYLAQSFNHQLDECTLQKNLVTLVSIIGEEPADIENLLNKRQIGSLIEETIGLPIDDEPTDDRTDDFNFNGEGNDEEQVFLDESAPTVAEQVNGTVDNAVREPQSERTKLPKEEKAEETTQAAEVITERGATPASPQEVDSTPRRNGTKQNSQWTVPQTSTGSNRQQRSQPSTKQHEQTREQSENAVGVEPQTQGKSVTLPSSHTPYGKDVFQKTPSKQIDEGLLQKMFPGVQVQGWDEATEGSRRERQSPGYTGHLDPVNQGTAFLLARSLEDGMMWLESPKPAALFPHEEAEYDGVHAFFQTYLMSDDPEEKIRLYVDYQSEVIFPDTADRDRLINFYSDNGLLPGCELTITRMENGGYRIGFVSQPTTIYRVPVIGIDPDSGLPEVRYLSGGIDLPCPVNERLLLAQQRFVDEDARTALYKLAEQAPDILQALILLVKERFQPILIDDLYRLNFQIRPVSFGYFMQVLTRNSGKNGIFQLENEQVRFNPNGTQIFVPKMQRRKREVDWEALSKELKAALSQLQSKPLEETVTSVINVLRQWLR